MQFFFLPKCLANIFEFDSEKLKGEERNAFLEQDGNDNDLVRWRQILLDGLDLRQEAMEELAVAQNPHLLSRELRELLLAVIRAYWGMI